MIGANGAGKSNFLGLFDMLGAMVDQRLGLWIGEQGGADRVLFGGVQQSEDMRVRLEFAAGKQGYDATIAAAAGGGVFFGQELAWFTGDGHDKPFDDHLGSGHAESNLPDKAHQNPNGVASHGFATQ